jgi:heme/copper-type cytochrome/quinol oxidase subunit 2
MPIELRVVTEEQYAQWMETAQQDLDAGKELLATFREINSSAEMAAR